MRLQSFQIEHVKSIINSGVCHLSEKDNITVLAGQNEAGKSAILEALNYFKNGPDEKFIKLSKRINSEPKITCIFCFENKDYNSEDDRINKTIKELKVVTCYRSGTSDEESGDIYISDESVLKMEEIISKIDLSQGIDSEGEEHEKAILKAKEEFLDTVVSHVINLLPEFIMYDSFSNLLPGEINIANIESNQAVQDFQQIFDVNFKEVMNKTPQERSTIKNSIEKMAELDLNTYWTQKRIDGIEDKYRFDINLIPNNEESRVEFLIHREDGIPLFMEQKSKGFQWFNAFMLRLKALGVENKNFNNYILLIDEPGQGLHETAQKNVKVVLEELAKKGMQILYTTHNPSLIGVNDDELLRIRLIFQMKDGGTKINNIAQFASSKEGASKDALSPIITAMGISYFGQIIDTSKTCIVVEGITDQYYLQAFKKLLDIKEDYLFIPACGVKNIRPLISILIGWGVKFKVIFDDGKEGKSVYRDIVKYFFPYNEDDLSRTIKKLDGFEGVEDLFYKTDFNKYILKERHSYNKANSEIAKDRKKELLARLFLEDIKFSKNSIDKFNKKTKSNFNDIFQWLKK